MSFDFQGLLKAVTKIVWPWLKKYVWPIIKDYILKLVAFAFKKLSEKLKSVFDERAEKVAEDADAKAHEAEQRAKVAPETNEREKQEAIARLWREVAEKLRQENEALRAKVVELTRDAESELHGNVRDLDPDLEMSMDLPVLVIGNERTTLPNKALSSAALPELPEK